MATVFASAADERYGFHLLNLIGSVQRNADVFERIVVHDLGLSAAQRGLLDAIHGVEVRTVPPFVPHWAQGFTWKPWIWTHLQAERIFWLDAGTTVLRSLGAALAGIDERGYFVIGQGFPVRALVPDDYFDLYGVDRKRAERQSVAAGIIGFDCSGRFWDEVVVPTYEDCLAGRSLGFSPQEAERMNYGLGRMEKVVVRNAQLFRWDQSVLNVHFLKAYPEDAHIDDLYRFGGWKSPRDHPQQVIWNHRRGGDYRYLARARYRATAALRARVVSAQLRTGLWKRRNQRFFQPGAYVRKARKILAARLG